MLRDAFRFVVGYVLKQCGLFECAFNIRSRCILIHELFSRDFWSMDITVRDNCLVFNPKHSRFEDFVIVDDVIMSILNFEKRCSSSTAIFADSMAGLESAVLLP